jgi:hypothetical protein
MKYVKEIRTLELFNEKADKLESGRFMAGLRANREFGVSVSWTKGGPLVITRNGPDEDAIDAFVLTFRFFIQDNEKTSLRNIGKLYRSLPITQNKKDDVDKLRTQLNAFLDADSHIVFGDDILTNRTVLETFVYGGLAHANRRKKSVFDEWMKSMLREPLTSEFAFILLAVAAVIIYIKRLNKETIGELKKISS